MDYAEQLNESKLNNKDLGQLAIIEQMRINAIANIRIADAIEEILRLVKKDQEDSAARQRQWDEEKK